MTDETKPLQAWCNDYEVIAARSEEEAREVLRKMNVYEEQDLDGEGWSVLANERAMRDEDGNLTTETVGDVLGESTEPRHLWSCEV